MAHPKDQQFNVCWKLLQPRGQQGDCYKSELGEFLSANVAPDELALSVPYCRWSDDSESDVECLQWSDLNYHRHSRHGIDLLTTRRDHLPELQLSDPR